MARTTGGRGVPQRGTPRPSAQELMRSLSSMGNEFFGASVAVSKAKINNVADIMDDPTQSLDFYNPKSYDNWAGEKYETEKGLAPGRSTYEIIDMNADMDSSSNWIIPGEKADPMEDTSPADLTLIPTSTTNPKRPRTVAAGYDADEQKLTVVFRDGTFYNYYEVDASEWAAFKANRSKGAVISRMLDFKPRGEASMSTISAKAQKAFYRYSRGFQIANKGTGTGQTKTTYKTNAQVIRAKKQAGKNPSKGGKNPKGK